MTVEERAEAIWELRKFWWLNSDKSLKQIEQHLRDQIEDCAKILEKGSKPQKGLTDHAFRRGGPFGLCTCGLQKEGHPSARVKSRKTIIKEIRALTGQTDRTEGKGIER